jgi:aldehyde dehydrogenase (NAD+)
MSASPVALSSVAFNPETRLYIDGQLRISSTGQTVEVLGLCTDAGLKAVFQQRNS